MIYLLMILWALCGALAHGLFFAHFQRKYPLLARHDYRADLTFSLIMSLAGPIGLGLAYSMGCNRYGFKFL